MKSLVYKLLLSFVILFSTTYAVLAEQETDEQRKASLIEGFTSLGIDDITAERLAKKVMSGELLDNMKEEYKSIPASIERFDQAEYYAEYVYPDGSKKIVTVRGGAYISGGVDYAGINYYQIIGARVTGYYGSVTLSFNASYRSGISIATINSVYNAYNNAGLSGNGLVIDSQSVSSGEAHAHLEYYYAPNYYTSGTLSLDLYIPVDLGSAYANCCYY